MPTHEYKDWKYIRRVDFDADGKVARYTINFYRRAGAADWYDQIRYDSHDIRKAPHFHMKIRSAFKDDDNAAVEEIESIVDNQVKELEGVLAK